MKREDVKREEGGDVGMGVGIDERTGTQENLVLESRVEIVVDGEEVTGESSEDEGWGADLEDSEDERVVWMGRTGVSLGRGRG